MSPAGGLYYWHLGISLEALRSAVLDNTEYRNMVTDTEIQQCTDRGQNKGEKTNDDLSVHFPVQLQRLEPIPRLCNSNLLHNVF